MGEGRAGIVDEMDGERAGVIFDEALDGEHAGPALERGRQGNEEVVVRCGVGRRRGGRRESARGGEHFREYAGAGPTSTQAPVNAPVSILHTNPRKATLFLNRASAATSLSSKAAVIPCIGTSGPHMGRDQTAVGSTAGPDEASSCGTGIVSWMLSGGGA